MTEIVLISGKGGTGKTSLAASFAVLGGKSLVIGDCDVDADDMHLLLKPDYGVTESFQSGLFADLNPDKCSACGKCYEICRFNSVMKKDGLFLIDSSGCEGCGYCAEVCPEKAVTMLPAEVGSVFKSEIKTGAVMIHARLKAGADNSGKLVAKVKQEAKKTAEMLGLDTILIDGSPGIGCPVVSSLTGADYVIIVTEPTPSGIHDLKRVYELVKKFHIRTGLIINKSDLNRSLTNELFRYAESEKIKVLSRLPYNEDFTKAVTNGLTAAEFSESVISRNVHDTWENVKKNIFRSEE